MQTAKDVEEYLSELLGPNNPEGLAFQKEFLSKWRPPQRVPSPLDPRESKILQELTRPPPEDMVLFRREGGSGGSNRGPLSKGTKKVIVQCHLKVPSNGLVRSIQLEYIGQ